MVSKKELEAMSATQKKCHRCCTLGFNISILLAFISFMFIPIIHSYASSWNYIIKLSSWDLVEGFSKFFTAMFAICYFGASLTIFCRYKQKRKLCRMDNCSFYICSVGIFMLAMVGINYIGKAHQYHENDFDFTCAQLSLDQDLPDDSFLVEANQVYRKANSLLCSAQCPCGMRDGILNRQLSEYNEESFGRQLNVIKDKNGATSVQKCEKYLVKVMEDNEDKEWQFQSVFAQLEEDHQCSGICSGIEDIAGDFYLFSNVNDGIPIQSCRKGLSEQIEDNIWMFHKLYLAAAILTGLMLSLIFLMLTCQCIFFCRRKCGGKKGNDNKKRSKNGMVLGSDDQDNEEAGGVEVANVGEPQAADQEADEKADIEQEKSKKTSKGSAGAKDIDPRD